MNETTAAYRQMIADGHQPTAQDVATLCDEVETLEAMIDDERDRVNVQREDIRTLRMERDQILSELVHLRAETEWLKSEAQFGTDEDQLDREAEAAGRIEWERHKRGVRGGMISDADNLGFWERRIARMQGRDEGRNERDQLRAELDALQRVNRILDDAAKDAQHYAYKLQEAQSELETLLPLKFMIQADGRDPLLRCVERIRELESERAGNASMSDLQMREIFQLRAELDRLRSAPVAVEVPRVCETCAIGRGDAGNGETCMYCRADNYCNWTALRSLASLNPIDPSRILKDGEREELDLLRQFFLAWEDVKPTVEEYSEAIESVASKVYALRSGEAEGRRR